MKEQLISFETAKLAKEKGFDIKCDNFYRDNKDLHGKRGKKSGVVPPVSQAINRQLAPTQPLLQKWLRDSKLAIVQVGPVDDWDHWGYNVLMEDCMSPFFAIPLTSKEYPAYEEALEAGLLEALNNLNDK